MENNQLSDDTTINDDRILTLGHDTYDRQFYTLPKDTISNDCHSIKRQTVKSCVKFKNKITKKSFYKSFLLSRLPIIKWLFMEYKIKTYFLADLISGFTVGVMNLPQSMGYSLLANLPPVNGLYISFFPLLMYTIFGTSKHLAIGAIAVVSLLSGQVIQSMADDYKHTLPFNQTNSSDALINKYKLSVASSLAFMVGIVQLIMGFTGLGIITTYFSDSFISGYTSGSAIHVLASQLKDLFGIKNATKYNGIFKIPRTIFDIIIKLPVSNLATVIASTICITYLVVFKEFINPRIKRRIKLEFPSELLLVIGITTLSYFLNLNAKFNIDIVKTIPKGLPEPKLPDHSLWPSLIKDSVLIAVIAFSINVSLATIFSRRHKYTIEPTQELYAYGASNMFASLFACFPSAGSLSRSTVMEASGGKTQIASVFSSVIILFVILWIGPLFEPLPKACLASIIVVALKSLLFQCYDSIRVWRINKYEGINWIGTFLSVVVLDVDWGLLFGVVLSIILIIFKDQRIKIKNLVQYKHYTNYVGESLIKSRNVNSLNVKIFKVQNSLYFVNIQSFKDQLFKLYGVSPLDNLTNHRFVHNVQTDRTDKSARKGLSSCQDEEGMSHIPLLTSPYIILDLSAMTYVDTGAVKALLEIADDYEKLNIKVYFCESQECFIRTINNMDLIDNFSNRLFVTVHDAILHITSTKLTKYNKEKELESE